MGGTASSVHLLIDNISHVLSHDYLAYWMVVHNWHMKKEIVVPIL